MPPARERIVDAAAELMRSVGLTRVTTKEIARAANCSEAAIYKYFPSKEALFLQVLEHRLPPLGALLTVLERSGGDVRTDLEDVAREAAAFYEQAMPIAGSLLAEPGLLARHREELGRLGAGPHVPVARLAEYVRRQQTAGQVPDEVDPEAVAAMIMGACFQRAFLGRFSPPAPAPVPVGPFASALVASLTVGWGAVS